MSTTPEALQQAWALHCAGQLGEAEAIYLRILESEPAHAQALHLVGLLAFQTGRGEQAVGYLERAVAAEPSQAASYASLGEVHRRLGQLAAARECFERAVQLEPRLVAVWYQLGCVCLQQEDWGAAERTLREAAGLQPNLVEAHDLLAKVHRRQGDLQQALADLRRVVECRGDSAEAHNNLGNLLHELGQLEEAVSVLETAARLRPDLAEVHYNLGNALRTANQPERAAESYRQALSIQPDLVAAQNNLGTVLQTLGDLEAARRAFQEVVRRDPSSVQAHQNLGALLRESHQYEAARDELLRAVELDPTHAPSHYNLGATLMRLNEYDAARDHLLEALRLRPNYPHPYCSLGGISLARCDYDEALAHFEKALTIDPDFAEAHFNRGTVRLTRGDYSGWDDYEWRLGLRRIAKRFPTPPWRGEPLAGRTILLYPEQGLGDIVHFIRYVPLVKALGATVLVWCARKLIPILSTCRGADGFFPMEAPPPPADTHASLMSLPSVFRTDGDSIPADVPYLSARPDLVEDWRRRLGAEGQLRVGIVWQGNPSFSNDHHRSIPLTEFAPLAAVEGVRFFSLQKGVGIEQLADAPFEVQDIGSQMDNGESNLCDAAAVIKNLDLVITCDTAMAHLAGALAAPVWLALSRLADWRWLMDRQDSPWYPTARLFRQHTLDQWKDVFEAMAESLRELAARSASSLPKAIELHCAGQLDEAERRYRELVAREPHNAEAWQLLGVAAHQAGRHAEAIEHLGRAVELDPANATFHFNLATAHAFQGRPQQAIAELGTVIQLEPNYLQAHVDLGALLAGQGRNDDAADCFRRALAIRADFAPAHFNLGKTLEREGRFAEAVASLQEAVRLDPANATAHVALGAAHYANRQSQHAQAAYERALELDPDFADAHNNLGRLLVERGEFAAARAHLERAARDRPDVPLVHNNRGIVAVLMGRYDEAFAHFERTLAVDPDDVDAHFGRAMLSLLLGDYAAGWREYEWRLKRSDAPNRPPGPQWNGEPLGGRTILLYGEQGLGDILQFIRYAPLVKARGGPVIVGCAKRLFPILSTCRGVDEFCGEDRPVPPFDVHAAIASLPGIFGTDAGKIPADIPYLAASAERVEHWRRELPSDGRLRVGIHWQGSPGHRDDRRRSIALAEFAPLAAVGGVRLVSLQRGFGVEQLERVSFEVEDLGSRLDEEGAAFCETAAVIKNLDLVITCDTAVAHLAGALAAPVWVALMQTPDWRWLLERDDSPWYPTMRLFRQQSFDRWGDVFEAMAARLRELVVEKQARGSAAP
jgi:tetratricopeptide (TPR) repeat protein